MPDGDRTWPGTTWEPAEAEPGQLAAVEAYADLVGAGPTFVAHGGRCLVSLGDVQRRTIVASVRKSVLAVLYGRLLGDGRLDLDATLADLGIDDLTPLTDTERTATVEHLLQARSGVYLPAASETPGMLRGRPERGAHAPGEHFAYKNWDFNVLEAILEQLAGVSVFEAAAEWLGVPLEMERFTAGDGWLHLQDASKYPAHHLFMTAADLARIGLLVARGGRWRDEQVVPREWVERMTAVHSQGARELAVGAIREPLTFGYGYLWWTGDPAVLGGRPWVIALGNGCHLLAVVPSLDLVFVHRGYAHVTYQAVLPLLGLVVDATCDGLDGPTLLSTLALTTRRRWRVVADGWASRPHTRDLGERLRLTSLEGTEWREVRVRWTDDLRDVEVVGDGPLPVPASSIAGARSSGADGVREVLLGGPVGAPAVAVAMVGGTPPATVFECAGTRSWVDGGAVDERTVFSAASLSKPVVAFVAMQLVERGVLGLDAPLIDGLPFGTVRMALNHTTGLSNRAGSVEQRWEPGTRWAYSGEAYGWLQAAIESATGSTLDEVCRATLFEPLGMDRSRFTWQLSFGDNAAAGHDPEGYTGSPRVWQPSAARAGVSLLTTAADYSAFVREVMRAVSGRSSLLGQAAAVEMTSASVRIDDGLAWSLGWGIDDFSSEVGLWHWGNSPGFRCFVLVRAARGEAIVVFTNGDGGGYVYDDVVRAYFPGAHLCLSPAMRAGWRVGLGLE